MVVDGPAITRHLSIGLFVAILTYFLLRFTSRERRNFPGDLVITFGAFKWTGLIFSLLLFGFMSAMLIKSGFDGPEGQERIFWSVYALSVASALFFSLSAFFTLMFPITVRGDAIHFMTWKFEKRNKDIAQIELAYQDKYGTVKFEFDDGDKLSIYEYDGGGEAVLGHIHKRLTEQLAEEFPHDADQTVH